ncbi:MAG: tetratricopeptide repeat protein [Burkholderiales bacterium]|nr:tetratricopeptide repeat protein [Burkholderiales bacterium]
MLPPDAPPALGRALELHRAGQRDAALALYDEAIRAQPGLAFSHYARGILLNELARANEALESLAEACRLAPAEAGWQADRGAIAFALNQREVAIDAFRLAVAADASRADVWGQLGDLLRSAGRLDEALGAYQSATRLAPQFVAAWQNLSFTAHALGNAALAEEAAHRAVRLAPQDPVLRNTLGNALTLARRPEAAQAAYREALRLAPGFAEATFNLALLLASLGQRDEAESLLRGLHQQAPQRMDVLVTLADTVRESGRVDESEGLYRKAVQRDPSNLIALWNLGNLCWKQGRHEDAAAWYERALARQPDHAVLISNLLYTRLYDPSLAPEALCRVHREYATRIEAPLLSVRPHHRNVPDPSRRLRVGYVTADFRNHPVAHFMKPVLAQHDPAEVEVFVYYNHEQEDSVTREFREWARHWVPCKLLSDDALAQRIFADGIDILIDLGGHTEGNRLPVFARKPAPVQITYLNYPGTTGLSAMDWRITDAMADPPAHDTHYTERLLRLPDSLWCYQPALYMPEVSAPPCLRNGRITFGSFNNVNKLTADTVALWSRLLRELPDARLLIATADSDRWRSDITARFAGEGVAGHRLVFRGKAAPSEFVRWMDEVDIALDSFPLNGGTTTMESLWMGVPVMSLSGQRFFARAGKSILSAAGYPGWAADTADAFIQAARSLAADREALGQLRRNLRSQIRRSPLCDARRFTLAIEAVYRHAWQDWCQRTSR